MKITNNKSISDTMYQYDIYVNKGDNNDFIEMTEWQNGEGYNITIGSNGFSLSNGEIDAIVHLRNCLQYDTTSE